MDQKDRKPDIWHEGVKNHCAKSKLSLLCFIDEILPQAKTSEEKDRLGRIKARIHNEISQLSLEIRILLKCLQAGGDISAFSDEIIRKEVERPANNKAEAIRRKFDQLPNPVLSPEV
jgi:hypothetical protein